LQTALQKKKPLSQAAEPDAAAVPVPAPAPIPAPVMAADSPREAASPGAAARSAAPVATAEDAEPDAAAEPERPADDPVPDAAPSLAAEPVPAAVSEPVSVTPAPELTAQTLQPHTWWQWVERLPLAGLTMAIARNSALVQVQDERYEFDVDPVQGALFNAAQQQKIQDALRTLIPAAQVQMQLQLPRGET